VIKVEIVELAPKVFRYYRNKVKNNKKITYDQARLKLTRNIMLAEKIPPRDQSDVEKGNVLYQYGCLEILVKNGMVIHLKNHKGEEFTEDCETDSLKFQNEWVKDERRYQELNNKLGIAN
jgi:hypothetical protein